MATSPISKGRMRHTAEVRTSCTCKCQLESSTQKTKRLKSRKERSHKRSGGKDACRVNSQQHRCCLQGNLDMGHLHSCSQNTSSRDLVSQPPLPLALAPTQEASVITASRLISHRGLFNHKVKSLNIQRLLLDKKEQTAKEKKTWFPLFSDPSGPHEEPNAIEATEVSKESSQTSVVMPDQKEKEKSFPISSDESPVVKRKKTHPSPNLPSSVECSPQRKKLSNPRRPPSLVLRQPLAVETRVDSQPQKDEVSPKSVSTVAQSLCNALRFPLLRERDLVEESRAVLLRALRKAHGHRLQENLKHLHSGTGHQSQPRKEVSKPKAKEKIREQMPAPVHSGHAFNFESEGYPVFENKRKGTKHFPWDLSPPPQQGSSQRVTWPVSHMDTSTGLLKDIFRLRASPEFNIDLGPSPVVTHQMFMPSQEPPAHFFGENHATFDPFRDYNAQQRESRSQPSYMRLSPRPEPRGQYSPAHHIPLKNDAFLQRYSSNSTYSTHALTSPHSHHYMQPYIVESPSPLFTSLARPKRWPFSPRKLY
ncbi:uncharacterized protein LOC144072574 isoform X2 [Stigmatopora argus]